MDLTQRFHSYKAIALQIHTDSVPLTASLPSSHMSLMMCWYTALIMPGVACPSRSMAYLSGTERASIRLAL